MSLSFVESHVWVGVLSFVSDRFMSSVISFSRVPSEVRVSRYGVSLSWFVS